MLKGSNDLTRISPGLIEVSVITIQNVKKQITYIHKRPVQMSTERSIGSYSTSYPNVSDINRRGT
jgi:hypothetical protein